MSLNDAFTGMIGGALIGSSAGVLLVLNGDIMGISGIMSNSLLNPIKSLKDPKCHWRWVFLSSFSVAVNTYVNYLTPPVALADERSTMSDVPIPSLIGHLIGGFLVGLGTRIGNGCTTGHGICGVGRFSFRSLAATVSFTCTSIATRFLVAPVRSWAHLTDFLRKDTLPVSSPLASATVMGALTLTTMARSVGESTPIDSAKSMGAAASGVLFAFGLAVSGMTKNSKVHDFLCFSNVWRGDFDPTLIAVMGSGILASWASYQLVREHASTTVTKRRSFVSPAGLPKGCSFNVPTLQTIDSRLMTGTVLFGVGWGLTGVCPGPAIYAASAGVLDAIVGWVPSFLVGSYIGERIVKDVWDEESKCG